MTESMENLRQCSSGGGTGLYRNVEGDFPVSALRGMDAKNIAMATGAGNEKQHSELIVLGKNVQSLQSESREEELFEELRIVNWDAVLISETWREKSNERWTTGDGHMFCGAGGKKGGKGVGIILHRRWTKGVTAFHAINERLCAIDVNIFDRRIRFIAVYMPHGGCDDEEVEGTYSLLTQLTAQGARENRLCITVGDWNAVVGSRNSGEDEQIIGTFGVGTRNERGDWLVNWATAHRFCIANTLSRKQFEEQWTYQKGGVRRQLDYCLVPLAAAQWIVDAAASDDIRVGVDHRTVKAYFRLEVNKNTGSTRTKKQKSMRAWKQRTRKNIGAIWIRIC